MRDEETYQQMESKNQNHSAEQVKSDEKHRITCSNVNSRKAIRRTDTDTCTDICTVR